MIIKRGTVGKLIVGCTFIFATSAEAGDCFWKANTQGEPYCAQDPGHSLNEWEYCDPSDCKNDIQFLDKQCKSIRFGIELSSDSLHDVPNHPCFFNGGTMKKLRLSNLSFSSSPSRSSPCITVDSSPIEGGKSSVGRLALDLSEVSDHISPSISTSSIKHFGKLSLNLGSPSHEGSPLSSQPGFFGDSQTPQSNQSKKRPLSFHLATTETLSPSNIVSPRLSPKSPSPQNNVAQVREAYAAQLKEELSSLSGKIKSVETLEKLGNGAFKVIHLVRANDNKQYAQSITSTAIDTKPAYLKYLHELKIAKTLAENEAKGVDHPLSVRFDEPNKQLEVLTEVYQDKDLSQYLKSLNSKGIPFSKDNFLDFAHQACASIGEAHRAGVAHKDVKQQNYLVQVDYSKNGQPIARSAVKDDPLANQGIQIARMKIKLADFGESLLMDGLHPDPILALNRKDPSKGINDVVVEADSTTVANRHPYLKSVEKNASLQDQRFKYFVNDQWGYGVMLARVLNILNMPTDSSETSLNWQNSGDLGLELLRNKLEKYRKKTIGGADPKTLDHPIQPEINKALANFSKLKGKGSSSAALENMLNCALDGFSLDRVVSEDDKRLTARQQRALNCDFKALCEGLKK